MNHDRKALTKGDVFAIRSINSGNTSLHIVVSVNTDQFYLVNIQEMTYWSNFETLQQELQTENEIVDFLNYLTNSNESVVESLGNIYDKNVLSFVQEHFNHLPNSRMILELVEMIKSLYSLQYEIKNLSVKSGDILNYFTETNCLIGRERVMEIHDQYALIPTNYFLHSTLEDEAMSREEFNMYLYNRLVEENLHIKIEQPFGAIEKMVLSLYEQKSDQLV